MDEDIVVPALFFLTVMVLSLGIPLVRAYVRRMESSPLQPRVPADLEARLDRIEAMVETVAVEVERLAEGQRFTTRLLSEGSLQTARPAAASPQPTDRPAEVRHG
jgi:hypothetical protein